MQSKISRSLMLYILFFSSIITLFVTGTTLYVEYNRDVDVLMDKFDIVENSYLDSVTNSLWQFDSIHLNTLLVGISKLPDIAFVEVKTKDNHVYKIGVEPSDNRREKIFDLSQFSIDSIGTLRVVASLSGVYERLRLRFLLVFLTSAIKTFLVSVFIYLIVQALITKDLSIMARFVSELDFQAEFKPLDLKRSIKIKDDELTLVQDSINETQAKLGQSYAEINESKESLRKLSVKLISSQEQERERIARDLHDDIGQKMTVLKLNFAKNFKKLPTSEVEMAEKRASIFSEIDDIISGIRYVAKSLRPSILFDFGILDAIRWVVEESLKNTSIDYNVDFCLNCDIKNQELSLTLFRIVQESINNAIKYSEATKIDVNLYDKRNLIILKICDNGIGIKKEDLAKASSTGIVGMRERLRPFNGSLEIKALKEGGTLTEVVIPLESNDDKSIPS